MAGTGGVRVYRIVVLGDGGVGKSALTLQYVQHNFIDYHDPTIEDAYQQRTVIDNEPCVLDILDTAGQEEFTTMREQYMRGGEGFVLCYSISDRHSYLEAEEYLKLILRVRDEDSVPMVLVANKVDLEVYGKRAVSPEEGTALANKFGCPFIETSAAQRRRIDDVFHTLVREIRKNKEERSKANEISRWKKLWATISRKTKRKKNQD
uniref:small monomeric GTPase n=1 Tax=Caligus rogercresseyi TaxID=217165 RepID=C1BN49_CALRO|nr:GTP-binding protein Rit2 [Caligus rogercresseyi]|eukprot:TRINITY_DN2203_c0_g1_i2.p1 TRINITY_DN2203_c0_g1~~TRINITY_DN2203_c0_g1_i2.p1  ORF type:complete len:207 (+),score=59.83 TRINITY_DN2203_c0_g1_i2:277-897(+)